MLRFGDTKVAKEKFYGAKNLWKFGKKTNSKHLIEYLDKVVGPLAFILPKMSGYERYLKLKKKIKIKTIY